MSKDFKPYISENNNFPEFTLGSILWGIFFALIFCVMNAYLGLRTGLTISGGIPTSILSMGIYKSMRKKNSILECNIIQSIGGVGESIASGVIFSLPSLFIWTKENNINLPSLKYMFVLPIIGGLLGIFFMLPLRKSLIVDEHANLSYPESIACTEILIASEQGGNKLIPAFIGIIFGAIYKFCSDGLKIFASQINYAFKFFNGAGLALEGSPALLGIGFIIGKEISCYMLAGGILGWCVIMPLIYQFGSMSEIIIYPATEKIINLSLHDLWGNYLRYIGAGAVATGGIFSLIKSLPAIIKTFREAIKNFKFKKFGVKRTEQDLSLNLIIDGILVILVLLAVFNILPIGWLGTILILLFGFFFATVASKMVGMVGVSNSPISGMALATLLISSSIFRAINMIDKNSVQIIFYIGITVCIISAVSGLMAQTLKTGFLIGATPKKQEIGVIIGVICSACIVVPVLCLLNKAFVFGSENLPAPQASLMKLVVDGVINGKLPWVLILSGVGITIFIEILGLPSMSFALGLFLPIGLTVAVAIGGIIREFFNKPAKIKNNKNEAKERGILFSSGLIAGEGLVGILMAIFAVLKIDIALKQNGFLLNNAVSILFFVLLCIILPVVSFYKKIRFWFIGNK